MFSPLQGEYIKKIKINDSLKNINLSNLDTLYVYDGQKILSKTKAVRLIGKNLGGVWKLISLISQLIPLAICDRIYDLVARNRYKIFGQTETCRLPSPSEASKFYP